MNKLNLRGGAAGLSSPARRRALLLGTALASSLIVLPMLSATPVAAQTTECSGPGEPAPGPQPIVEGSANPIVCVNSDARTANAGSGYAAILLVTAGAGAYINLTNSGNLEASTGAGSAFGISVVTTGPDSPIAIDNSGDVAVSVGAGLGYGILGRTSGDDSPIAINNSGDIGVAVGTGVGFGITSNSNNSNSPVEIDNSGDIAVTVGTGAGFGISGNSLNSNSPVEIDNSGDIAVTAGGCQRHHRVRQ